MGSRRPGPFGYTPPMSSSPTSLRHAVAADRPFLLALTSRLSDFPLPPWRTAGEISKADHHLIDDALSRARDDVLLLIAERGSGAPAGAMLVTTREDYFTRAPHAHVEVLAVAPEAAGLGVARLLMEAAEHWSRDRGYRHVTLNVFDRNQRARGLYEHLGYQPETVHYLKAL